MRGLARQYQNKFSNYILCVQKGTEKLSHVKYMYNIFLKIPEPSFSSWKLKVEEISDKYRLSTAEGINLKTEW